MGSAIVVAAKVTGWAGLGPELGNPGSSEVCPPNNLSAQQQRHRHLPFPLSPPAFPMVLSRAPREMKMSKGVVSFCHKCNVSKILLSFEKVSFGKFRAILKNALFRETAPIAPIFFGGSGGGGGGGSPDPAQIGRAHV